MGVLDSGIVVCAQKLSATWRKVGRRRFSTNASNKSEVGESRRLQHRRNLVQPIMSGTCSISAGWMSICGGAARPEPGRCRCQAGLQRIGRRPCERSAKPFVMHDKPPRKAAVVCLPAADSGSCQPALARCKRRRKLPFTSGLAVGAGSSSSVPQWRLAVRRERH